MDWSSNTVSVSDVREWRDDKKLEIRPDFQRKEVWSRAAQIMLIDSIIKNIPIPKIYLETKMKQGVKYRIVIDGQQRLTAILDYIDGKYTLPEVYGKKWAGKKFVDLTEKEQNIILGYEIDTNCLNNPTEEEVRQLYSRVNTYTVQLNAQELRRADYPGDFIKLAEELADDDFFGDSRMFTVAMTRRMLDIEYIEELIAIIIDGVQNKKETIDNYCEMYQSMPEKDNVKAAFLGVIGDISKIFTEKNEMIIRKSRFKQRSDFYSLFAAIHRLRQQNRKLDKKMIPELQRDFAYLTENIGPHAEDKSLSDYAIRCTSDANSYVSRIWRVDFINGYLEKAYKE